MATTSLDNPGENLHTGPTPPPDKTQPVRRRRRVLQFVASIVALLLAGSLLLLLVLPWVVRAQVTAALEGMGVSDARFVVRRATPWRTTLADITALRGDLRVASIDVTYEPLAVIRGQFERVRIEGVEVRAAVREGALVSPVIQGAADNQSGGNAELPFRSFELASSSVTLNWDGQILHLPVSGTVERTGASRATANLSVQMAAPVAGLALPGGAQLRTPSGVLMLEVTAEATLGVKTSVVAELRTRGASLTHLASGASLGGITMRVPITINAEARKDAGSFEFASVTVGGEKLAPAAGAIAVRDKRADFSMKWAALPDSVLSTKGWLEMGDEGLAGEITADLPAARLDDAATLAGRVPALRGWKVTANGLAADAALTFERSRPRGRVAVKVTGADVASEAAGAELHDVNGAVAVTFTDAGVSTPGGQRLTAGRMAFGEVELTDASLAFRLDGSGAVTIDQLSAGWLGGRVSTKGVRIDPETAKFDVTLVADRLSLRELLELTAEGRARGEGLMSGRVGLRFDGSEVSFLGGQLHSETPTGELEVLDTKWLGETMDKSDPRFTAERELAVVKERILTALADFSYDRLTFDFAEEPASRGRLSVSTHGKGRVGDVPQELDFTLNFRGVNDVLRHGLRLGEVYERLTNPEIGR